MALGKSPPDCYHEWNLLLPSGRRRLAARVAAWRRPRTDERRRPQRRVMTVTCWVVHQRREQRRDGRTPLWARGRVQLDPRPMRRPTRRRGETAAGCSRDVGRPAAESTVGQNRWRRRRRRLPAANRLHRSFDLRVTASWRIALSQDTFVIYASRGDSQCSDRVAMTACWGDETTSSGRQSPVGPW